MPTASIKTHLETFSNQKRKLIFACLKLLSFTFCIVLFLLLMLDSYYKFTNKMTNIGVRTEPIDLSKHLHPCLTVCPMDAYRKRGFFYTQKDFIQQTFNKEEIFQTGEKFGFTQTITVLNESVYTIDEIQSIYMGRCHMVCPKQILCNVNQIYFTFFNRSMDMKVFVHPKEYSKWISMAWSPRTITSLRLDIPKKPEIVSYEVMMTEKLITSLNKGGQDCKDYSSATGYQFNKTPFYMCKLTGLSKILEKPSGDCLTIGLASRTYKHYFDLVYGNERTNWLSECPAPCEQTVFELRLEEFHRNNIGAEVDISNETIQSGVMFLLRYDKLVVEKHVETLIYDTGNFLAQIGGNLGLFLGFSCLSLLLGVLNCTKKILKCKFNYIIEQV